MPRHTLWQSTSLARGWHACVAENLQELEALAGGLLNLTGRSRGRVIVRTLVRLRHTRTTSLGFPLGREFRFFVCNGRILAFGYYWDDEEAFSTLSSQEEAELRSLVLRATRQLNVPYVAIDVGQQESGAWTVIEVNDAQFVGHSEIPLLKLWSALRDLPLV